MAKSNTLLSLMYDGLSDPRLFQQNFNIHVACHEWSEARQLVILPVLLKDKAKRVYDLNPKTYQNPNVNTVDIIGKPASLLVQQLVNACEQQKEVMLYQFYERSRKPGESISKFAQSLQELLIKSLPNLSPNDMSALLRAQLCLHVPQELRALIQFSSTFGTESWDTLLASLDKTCPSSLLKSESGTRWDTYSAASPYKSESQSPLIKEEPLDVNYTQYSRYPSGNQEQNSDGVSRFNGKCSFCKFHGHKIADCRKRMRLEREQGQGQQQYQTRPQPSNRQQQFYPNQQYSPSPQRQRNPPSNMSSNNTEIPDYGQNFYQAAPQYLQEEVQEQNENEYPFFLAENNATSVDMEIFTVGLLNVKDLPKIDVKIHLLGQPEQVLRAILDSASTHSFIAPHILSSAQRNVIKSKDETMCIRKNVKVNGATGTEKSTACITNCDIGLSDWYGTLPFVITGSVDKYPMVLGSDFLRKYGVILDFAKNKIRIDEYDLDINLMVTNSSTTPKVIESPSLLSFKQQLDEFAIKLNVFKMDLSPMNVNATELLNAQIDTSSVKQIQETSSFDTQTISNQID
jgi:hypothetical protein